MYIRMLQFAKQQVEEFVLSLGLLKDSSDISLGKQHHVVTH